jgi:hypothetical protein
MSCIMRFHRIALAIAMLALFVPAGVTAAQGVPRPRSAIGYIYTVRVTSGQTAHGSARAPASFSAQNYVGHVTSAGSRGRVDIVEGAAEGMFEKGDYLLFDTTDVIIVHPSAKEFVPIPRELASNAMDQLTSMGVKVTLADEKVTLDSVRAVDTVSGLPTRHYRMTVAFNMAMDAGVMQQQIATQSVNEYWTATIPDMRSNPLLRVNALAGGLGGLFKSLAARVDTAAAKMGQSIALKSRSTTTMMLGPGATMETEQTSEVSELRRGTVDESLLMLPAGYKAAVVPGQTTTPASADANAGVKWSRPPEY